MLTKTKIALAAASVLGSASAALAQGFDPYMGNRYPAYNEPYTSQSKTTLQLLHVPMALHEHSAPVERNAPVRLQTPESFVTRRRRVRHR